MLTYGDNVCVLILVSSCVFTGDKMNITINKICQETIYCMTDHSTVVPLLSSGPRCFLKIKIVLNNLIFFSSLFFVTDGQDICQLFLQLLC